MSGEMRSQDSTDLSSLCALRGQYAAAGAASRLILLEVDLIGPQNAELDHRRDGPGRAGLRLRFAKIGKILAVHRGPLRRPAAVS